MLEVSDPTPASPLMVGELLRFLFNANKTFTVSH